MKRLLMLLALFAVALSLFAAIPASAAKPVLSATCVAGGTTDVTYGGSTTRIDVIWFYRDPGSGLLVYISNEVLNTPGGPGVASFQTPGGATNAEVQWHRRGGYTLQLDMSMNC